MASYSKQFIDIAPDGIPTKVGFSGTLGNTSDCTIKRVDTGTTSTLNWSYSNPSYKELNPVTLHTVPAGAKDEVHLYMGFKRIMSHDYFERYAFVSKEVTGSQSADVANATRSIEQFPDMTWMAVPNSYGAQHKAVWVSPKHTIISDDSEWFTADVPPGAPTQSTEISDFPYDFTYGGDFTYETKGTGSNGFLGNSSWLSLSAGNEKLPLRINAGNFKSFSGGIITKDVVGTVDTYPLINSEVGDIQVYGYGYGVSTQGGGGWGSGMSGQKILDGMILNSGKSLKITLRHMHAASGTSNYYKCPSGIFRAYFWGYVNRIS